MPSIVASKDRIGVIFRECNTWIELDKSGQLAGQWTWASVAPGLVIGNFGVTSSNEVYAVVSVPSATWVGYLDKATSTWGPVDTSQVGARNVRVGAVMGCDGENIVYRSGETELSWSKPTE